MVEKSASTQVFLFISTTDLQWNAEFNWRVAWITGKYSFGSQLFYIVCSTVEPHYHDSQGTEGNTLSFLGIDTIDYAIAKHT